MEKLEIVLFTSGYFSLGGEKEIDSNKFLKFCSELAKFIDKILDKHDDHPCIYYTGNICRYFRNFRRVNRSEHGRSAHEFNKILDYEGGNCYIRSANGCFLKCVYFMFQKVIIMEYFEFIQSYKRRTNVMLDVKYQIFASDIK